MATATAQNDRQPERYTLASIATPQRTQAEAECKRVSTQGMVIGSGIAAGVSYIVHKLLEAPAYVTMSRNVKYAMGIGQYIKSQSNMTLYYENKCRKERGLPPV